MDIGNILQERYQIEQVLGQGSMGITYKAIDLATQTLVAVKQLHLVRMQQWKTLEMFEREAKILQQLDHPRVPTYIDYFSLNTDEGMQFLLVQEYVEGKTLKQLIEQGWRGTETEILDIFLDLVDILVTLHSFCPPVIHRDVNPKNIIISRNSSVYPTVNDVYLVDFGAVQDRIRTTVIGGTTIVGTFGYVPFEQFSGQAVPASDYYALGATLLYMLTHRHPSEFPTMEDLKPQIEPFLQGSPGKLHLLNGLLDPSLKKRIASPERIKEIFDEYPPELVEQSASSLKPAQTNIEKVKTSPTHISFRIPKQKLGIVVKRNVLHLRPQWMSVNEELLGLNSGELWRVPVHAIHPSDITWYFGNGNGKKKGNPVLGVNYAGETFEIGAHLDKAEIHWLTEEINEYVWDAQHQKLPPEQSEEIIYQGPSVSAEYPPQEKVFKPSDTHIKKTQKGDDQLRFRIPKTISKKELGDMFLTCLVSLAFASVLTTTAFFLGYNNGSIGWVPAGIILTISSIFWAFGLGLFFTAFSRLFGSIVLFLNPEWIRISRRCFGIGFSRHVPTAAIHQHDVIRYFQKSRLSLGINYAEKTLNVGTGLSQSESEWLIQEITDYIRAFARPIPDTFPEPDLEMK